MDLKTFMSTAMVGAMPDIVNISIHHMSERRCRPRIRLDPNSGLVIIGIRTWRDSTAPVPQLPKSAP